MRTSHLFLLFLFLNYSLTMAQKPKLKEDDKKSIDSLTKGLKKQVGLLISYHKEGEIYFEIGNDLLDKDLLMVTRFVQFPANFQAYQNAGSKTSEQLIHFSKKGSQIVLTQKSYINIADQEDPIAQSVSQNNFPPILATFPIKNKETALSPSTIPRCKVTMATVSPDSGTRFGQFIQVTS